MQKSLKASLFLLFILAGLTLFVKPSGVLAAAAPDITTSPVSITLNAKPGTTTSTQLTVRNNGVLPVDMDIQVDTFKANGTTGQAQIQTPQPNDQSINWVHFSQNSFTAQPNTWTYVQMTISLPKSASLGYYYAVLFKPVVAVTPTGVNTNVIHGYNAVLVLLNALTANEHPQLQLASFSSDKKFYEYLPVTFSVNIHNNGNIYLPPSGDIYISRTSSFANTIDTIHINPAIGNVLPGTNRIFTAKWADGFPVFEYKELDGQVINNKQGKPVEQLKWNFSQIHKLRFGEYYARLVMVYNNGVQDVPTTSVLSFWVVPWKMILIMIFVLAFIGVGLWATIRTIVRRTKRLIRKK